MVKILKKAKSNVHLHAFVFLAQKIADWKETQYSFDFSSNLPFSPELEDDFIELQKKRKVFRDLEGNYKLLSPDFPAIQNEKLLKLAEIPFHILIILSYIIYIRKYRKDIPFSYKRISEFFLIPQENIQEAENYAKNIGLNI